MSGSQNRFQAWRVSIAMVAVLGQLACRATHPSPSGNEMRSALHELAGAEDVYYATNLRYSADQSLIVSLTFPSGVQLSIDSADEHGWHASASHELGVETCSESGLNDGTAAFAVVSTPICKPLRLSATLRDVRHTGALTPRDTGAPSPIELIISGDTSPLRAPAGTAAPRPVEGVSILLPEVDKQPDNLGYPARTVDRLAVRRLLLARSYDALDYVLAAYADSALHDYKLENRLFDAYSAFNVAVPEFEAPLTEWVRSRPTSAAARLARAYFFKASGWNARGSKYARETSGEQFDRMGKFFGLSIGDLDTALRLAPNSIVAYRQLIDLATAESRPGASRRFLDRGLALQPYSFVLRLAHMYNLLPRWNGSYEAMAKFAAESAPYAKRNPRIKSLGGFVDWDKGRVAEAAGKSGDAIEAYQRALQFGDLSQFLYERGTFYSAGERYPEALEDLNSALLQYPQDADALNARSRVEYELGREASGEASAKYYSQAFRDVELAAALKPTDHNIQEHLAFIRENIPEFTPETLP